MLPSVARGAESVVQAFCVTSRGILGVLLLASLACAQSEPLPGLIPTAEFEAEHKEAIGQERDAREAVAEKARMLGYSEAEIARVLEPTMVRTGSFRVTLEDGTRIRFPWHRTGFAENSVANTDREIARDAEGRALRLERGVTRQAEATCLHAKQNGSSTGSGSRTPGRARKGW